MAGKYVILSRKQPVSINLATPEGAHEIELLRQALEPFASSTETFVDADGWKGPMNKERIVDWFGPSDFRQAATAF